MERGQKTCFFLEKTGHFKYLYLIYTTIKQKIHYANFKILLFFNKIYNFFRLVSYITNEVATDKFKDSTSPSIGI